MALHLTKNKIPSPLHRSHDFKYPVPGSFGFAPGILPHSCLSPTATSGPLCISYTSDLTRASVAATSQRSALRRFPSSEAVSFPHSSHQHHRLCVLYTLYDTSSGKGGKLAERLSSRCLAHSRCVMSTRISPSRYCYNVGDASHPDLKPSTQRLKRGKVV